MLALLISFSVFSHDEEGSGGKSTKQPTPILVCVQAKGDGEGTGGKSVVCRRVFVKENLNR